MRILKFLILLLGAVLAACVHNQGTPDTSDYVEIDNPAMTMSPNAQAKIFVPRDYVENGIPRGGEVVKMGTEEVAKRFRQTPNQPPPAPSTQRLANAADSLPVSSGIVSALLDDQAMTKHRIALIEVGQIGMKKSMYEKLKPAQFGVIIDPGQAYVLRQIPAIPNEHEKVSLAKKLNQDYSSDLLIVVMAPEGVSAGNHISAELYDGMAGGLLRRFDISVPTFDTANAQFRESLVSDLLETLAARISDYVALLPWYGRITEVDGNMAYIAAGKESGIKIGQVLNVHHRGKFIERLGYAQGEKIGSLMVSGFVGVNGSFAEIKNGEKVQSEDIVSIE